MNRRSAFTLPEVLAALLLMGIVLPVVMKGVSLALFASADARRRIEAVGLAETKLAELSASTSTSRSGSSSGDFGEERPGFKWTSSAESVDTDLSEIRVRVSWSSRGQERSVDLATFAFAGTTSSATATTPAAGGTTP